MTFHNYKFLIFSDLYRVTGSVRISTLLKYIFKGGAYTYIFWMRTSAFTYEKALLRYSIYPIAHIMLKHLHYKYGIAIPYKTEIDSGFRITHSGGIVVHSQCKIGKNFTLSQGVTLGHTNRGRRRGCPVIGNNVYVGPGAKIIGHITIGDNVAVGANCVVTKDVPDNSVIVGVPGKVISQKGSNGYIERVDYERFLHRKEED